jgi:coenzyme F420-reducing hydrogenase delta subunit/NAD-dependent dihydropyrimidine dehydrogenase PreA subunit
MVRYGEEGEQSTLLLRTPGGVARALPADTPSPAMILRPLRSGTIADLEPGGGEAAEVLPVRSRIEPERCRSCGRCVDVCPFHALSLAPGSRAPVTLEPSLCRGCGLCSAVCPTQTALQSALAPEWWADRFDRVAAAEPETERDTCLILACQRRAGALEKSFEEHGLRFEVVRFRCVGQIDAGTMLELYRRPFRGILVAGCSTGRCRFGKGARLAGEQLERAESIIAALGLGTSRLMADWSANRAGDLLDGAVERLIARGVDPVDGGGH